MAAWNFPPMGDFDMLEAIQQLASETVRPVKDQHIVSRVILKRFASPGSKGYGWQLGRYDKVRSRKLDPMGLKACAKVSGFVLYASGSAEEIWQEVENRANAAIEAAETGALSKNKAQVRTCRDILALHLVRSPHYRRIHEQSFSQAIQDLRNRLLAGERALLEVEFRRLYGLNPAGTEAFNIVADQLLEQWENYERSGALFRVSVERAYYRVSSAFKGLSIEVLHAPQGREFIISDSPAFTFRSDNNGMKYRMAIGDSHGVGMPVSRKCFLAIGPDPKDVEASHDMMDRLNRTQLELAEQQVYYRPGSVDAQEEIRSASATTRTTSGGRPT